MVFKTLAENGVDFGQQIRAFLDVRLACSKRVGFELGGSIPRAGLPSIHASRPASRRPANQAGELTAWAERCGHTVIKVYEDKGTSGAKGRDMRPAFDAMLKATVRRAFDMLLAHINAIRRGKTDRPR